MPESLEKKRLRADEVVDRLRLEFPGAKTALLHRNAFELLIATILSAQCTDVRVNIVTPPLFEKAPTPEAFVKLGQKKIQDAIKSINFFRNKAKNIFACCQMLLADFKGEVPRTLEELVSLPGVGRKTANVLLGSAFETPGVVVDTHVQRLTNRLKFVNVLDPKKIEPKIEQVVQKKDWVDFSHLLILHGRKICKARNPLCQKCNLVDLCPSAFKASDSWKK